MTATVKHAFAPLADDRTRLLVLGSLPGDASLKAAQYYAHPQNGFWRLIGVAIGRDLHAMAYADRIEALRVAGIGLWDVIASAERPGSLDAAIRSPQAADLRGLISALPNLKAVAFNGSTAAKGGRKILAGVEGLTLIDLPSSSPAHATRTLAEKAERWALLKDVLAIDR
ncbi:DNA-deoxyinosine glycosylase [Brevundimonas sp.]|uniref:DNA-deoxyinosine glycosylase n=1 Tax=Brevundimonas sp. TaxID=1871086 RepID=UPI00262AC67E|nr:DNA-deoxyinosine glycosylase [Brevundimonas sp.]